MARRQRDLPRLQTAAADFYNPDQFRPNEVSQRCTVENYIAPIRLPSRNVFVIIFKR